MKRKFRIALFSLLILGVLFSFVLYLFRTDIAVLNPQGIIGLKQRNLLVISTLLMLIVVIPVFVMTLVISWKYRATNKKAKYSPDWDKSMLAETIWWGVPCAIILVLSILTWKGSQDLDPFKPIESATKPMTIQVIALQWKWLFIYPELNIATVNFVQFPEKTPINFELTADAPMNSFWIPQLGGQIFAMPGMKTTLYLMADTVGVYRGASANISGRGFAGMSFNAKSSSEADFLAWVQMVKESGHALTLDEYTQLAQPSEYNPVSYYLLGSEALFDRIVMKYMAM